MFDDCHICIYHMYFSPPSSVIWSSGGACYKILKVEDHIMNETIIDEWTTCQWCCLQDNSCPPQSPKNDDDY